MSVLIPILVSAAARIGAPLVQGLLEKAIGKTGAELAGEVIEAIAERAGKTPEELPELPAEELDQAVKETEADMPAILAAWNESQRMTLELQRAEMEKGPTWAWAWRPAAMWTIVALWVWALVVVPVANAFGADVAAVDLATLFQLSLLFMGLYMGGHTLLRGIESWRK